MRPSRTPPLRQAIEQEKRRLTLRRESEDIQKRVKKTAPYSRFASLAWTERGGNRGNTGELQGRTRMIMSQVLKFT